jgi:AbrB family looped-hinge helix DNA binding protein
MVYNDRGVSKERDRMEKSQATVKGQVVIPARIRRRLEIKKGTRFLVEEKEGSVILTPLNRNYYLRWAGIYRDILPPYEEWKKEREADEDERLGERERAARNEKA